jgi:hypothetical protein
MINLKKKSKGERWNIMKNQLFHAIGLIPQLVCLNIRRITASKKKHKKNNNIVVADHTTEKNKNVSTIDHRYSKNFVGKENLKVSSKDTTDHVGRKNMIKNVNEEELMKKEKKKPMEQYKRMQCEIVR